jgi:two-component system, LytTR family, response regulator
MRKLRVLMADDEPLVRSGLRSFVTNDARLELIGEAADGAEAIALVRQHAPDLLLLDVQMPEQDGFAVVDALGEALPPAVVFVTAFDAYAIRAFDVHAVDYLLKPFEEDRFTVAIGRACERLSGQRPTISADVIRQLADTLATPAVGVERLLVKHDGRVTVVPLEEVDWIESADNYVRIHSRGRSILLRETLRDLEEQLPPSRFARVHRGAMVNLARVRELQPMFGGESVILLTTGAKVPLSRGYRDRFRERLSGRHVG